MKMYAETVGEYTEAHERRLLDLSYRIWKRHLTEQADQRRREREAIAAQAQDTASTTLDTQTYTDEAEQA